MVWVMGAYRAEIAERRRQTLQAALGRGAKLTSELYCVTRAEGVAAQLVQEVRHG
ncbi:hypothetical protein J2S92_003579 [Arthrobacter bambusae]|nr:hypothetical protein [Arthrobacter bambusae]MDQ0237186.1 hypothetical protein [Arthrobacter bambusae]